MLDKIKAHILFPVMANKMHLGFTSMTWSQHSCISSKRREKKLPSNPLDNKNIPGDFKLMKLFK